MNNTVIAPSWQHVGMALIRMIVGFFMIYHGWEIFDAGKMNEYLEWDVFKNSSGKLMVYTGKVAELGGGILLFLGLFTRIASLILIVTMAYIAFILGNGKVWYEDQHPFLLVLLSLVFLLLGGGRWSADSYIQMRK